MIGKPSAWSEPIADDCAWMARARLALATSGDGEVHVIHCDQPGCHASMPFPGPEFVAQHLAAFAGWSGVDDGPASCPQCRRGP